MKKLLKQNDTVSPTQEPTTTNYKTTKKPTNSLTVWACLQKLVLDIYRQLNKLK
jgi:hypothetical protein